jgi:DNA-binding winged helix-turn-helix (wHTH) protein/TolB-like protein/Tfp pilus assembly protein PilF
MPTEEELNRGFNLGDWEVLPGHGELHRGDRVERPEPKVFAVLIALAKRDTNLVTKQELIDEVWDGRPTTDEPIARCLSQLRGHLDDRERPHQFIETLQRRGYRLKQAVELHSPSDAVDEVPGAVKPGPSLFIWRLVAIVLGVGFLAIAAFNGIPQSPPANSIVVMPFENLSGNESDEYLVLGFKEELVQILQGLDDYTVKSGRVNYEKESDEILALLGVESLLFGSLRRSGDELKINYQIFTDGGIVSGGDITGSVADLFALQESLASKVREDLIGKSTQTLIKRRPSDSEAYDSYMRGVYALEHRGDPGNLEKAIELFENAIDLDKKYGPSYLALATVYTLMPNYRSAPPMEMDSLALQTINAGIAADPNLKDAGSFIWGYVYHKQKRWDEAEAAYLRAINADVIDSNAFNWYSRMLASVGRLNDSLRIAKIGLELDPGSPSLNSRVAMSYTWLSDNEHAREFYDRANNLGWRGSVHKLGYAFMLMQTGQLETAQNLAITAENEAGRSASWVAPFFSAFGDPSDAIKVQAAIAAFDEAAEARQVTPLVELMARSLLGDLDGAMRIAELLLQPGEAFEMDLLFIPELDQLRQHPDFMPLMKRLGITDYWASRGCVWDGDKVNCPSD